MEKIEKTGGEFEYNLTPPHYDLSVKSFMDMLKTIPKYDKLDLGSNVVVYRGYEDFILEYNKKTIDMGRVNYIAHTLRLTFYFIYNYLEVKTND